MVQTEIFKETFFMSQHRVLSGIRATGRLHLGNYLGAVKGMLELQDNPDYETYYMVADAHAITTPYVVEELRTNRREVVIDYLAAGLDPEKSVLFLQSDVGSHFELAYYLSSLVSIARMRHLPTFKEKVKQYPKQATMALLNYPVLMAADILAYEAHSVPVGVDQEPHLEIAREIARKINAQYGTDFPEPIRFATAGEYVPSLKGTGKMSKSVEGSYINLSDGADVIRDKLMSVPTDSGKGETVPKDGGVSTLLKLVELIQGKDLAHKYKKQYLSEGIRYKDLKIDLAQAIASHLAPIQEKRRELEADSKYVDKVIERGNQQASQVSSRVVARLRQKMGLLA